MPGKPANLAMINGSPTRSVTLLGQDYRVGTLRPRDIADLQGFLMRKIEDPKKATRKLIEGLPHETAIAIWDREMKEAPPWPPTLDSPQGQAALMSPDGMAEAVYVCLHRTVAGFTREQAAKIADDLSIEEFNAMLDAVSPQTYSGDDGDPKAGATEPPGTS